MIENRGNSTVLVFPEKLDTTNSKEYMARFFKELEGVPEDMPVICDLDNTTYISSSGLRLALLLERKHKNIKFINADPAVYEIFEETGITNILSVKRKPRKIDPITGEPLARGSNGEIYVIEDDIIVKMFSPNTTREEIVEEWKNAQTALALGVPSVICYQMLTDGERLGIMFERMKTASFATVVYSDYEHFDRYAVRFAGLLKELHGIHDKKHDFHSVKTAFSELIFKADYLSEDEKAKMTAFLDAVPDSDCVIHGDFHPKNIGENMGLLILLDLAEIGYGHPLFDFMASYYDLILSGQTVGVEHPEITKQFFGLSVEELAKLWDILLGNYFPGISEEKKRYFNETINMILGFKLMLFPVLHPNHTKEKHNAWIELGRERFLDHYEELMQRVDVIHEMIEQSFQGGRGR